MVVFWLMIGVVSAPLWNTETAKFAGELKSAVELAGKADG